jgi:hypothetical protein
LRIVRNDDPLDPNYNPGANLLDDDLFDPDQFHPELPEYTDEFDQDDFDDDFDDDDPDDEPDHDFDDAARSINCPYCTSAGVPCPYDDDFYR